VNFLTKHTNGFEKSFLNSNEPLLIAIVRFLDAFLGFFLFTVIMAAAHNRIPYLTKAGLIIFVLILIFFHFNNIYRSFRFSTLQYEIYSILFASVSLYALLFIMAYIIGITDILPRKPIIIWMVAWPLSLALIRIGIRKIVRRFREKGYNIKKAVIAGKNKAGINLASHIRNNPWTGTSVVGFFTDEESAADSNLEAAVPVLGKQSDLAGYVKKHHIDILYITVNGDSDTPIRTLMRDLEDTPVAIHYVPDIFFIDLVVGGEIIFFDERPIIVLRGEPIGGIARVIKRLFDILISLSALLVLSPLMAAIAVLIKKTSSGPALFVQNRYGINGEKIKIYKFRTMHENGTDNDAVYQQARENDPRVTAVGAFLRKTSLDELPQLINVIQGRMSLVGPRPHPVAMNEHYKTIVSGYMIRHKVKPGLTGLAQVKGFRGETDTFEKMEKRIEFDLMYIREWSLLLDLEILLRTLFVFLFQKNAY